MYRKVRADKPTAFFMQNRTSQASLQGKQEVVAIGDEQAAPSTQELGSSGPVRAAACAQGPQRSVDGAAAGFV